MDIEVPVCHIL